MTTTKELEARIELLEARVETLGRRLSQVIGESPEMLDEQGNVLYEALKQWRFDRARADGVPQYVVFPDKALTAIAATRPTDKYELAKIKGIADKRVEMYGDEVVQIVVALPDREW